MSGGWEEREEQVACIGFWDTFGGGIVGVGTLIYIYLQLVIRTGSLCLSA